VQALRYRHCCQSSRLNKDSFRSSCSRAVLCSVLSCISRAHVPAIQAPTAQRFQVPTARGSRLRGSRYQRPSSLGPAARPAACGPGAGSGTSGPGQVLMAAPDSEACGPGSVLMAPDAGTEPVYESHSAFFILG
jgi:hypothetical protein